MIEASAATTGESRRTDHAVPGSADKTSQQPIDMTPIYDLSYDYVIYRRLAL